MDLSTSYKIHEGRFSLVYLLEKGGEKYIVKQLHPRISPQKEQVEKFKKEATMPFIPGVTTEIVEYIEKDGDYYILKKYIEGNTLKELHKKYTGRRYLSDYLRVYQQVLEKIKALHMAGYFHADIKPSNILWTGTDLQSDGEVILLDLGLALPKDQLPSRTLSHLLPFSMVYGAPELMLNEPGSIGAHTDLFSWGICLYEALSGAPAYQEKHPAILLQKMLSVPLPPLRKVSAALNAFQAEHTLKPGFKKPVAQYTYEEMRSILEENIKLRKQGGDMERRFDDLISEEKKRKRLFF